MPEVKRKKTALTRNTTLTMVGLDQARKELSVIVKEAKKANARYLVSERGKPQAVVIGIDDFLRNVLRKERASVIAEIQLEADERKLSTLSKKDIDREIKSYRKSKA